MVWKLQFGNGFGLSSSERRGGLGLLWSCDINDLVMSHSQNYIDVRLSHVREEHEWRFTGFYGDPNPVERSSSCQQIKDLQQNTNDRQ